MIPTFPTSDYRAGPSPASVIAQPAKLPAFLVQRLFLYLLLLGGLSSFVCFRGLGEGMLGGDEALYASVMDNMWSSGDWVQPMTRPGKPHLHKPPLYYWISASTYGCFDNGELRYRVWAAVFGVGCVLITALLGCLLFTPEIGLLAGLFLIGNYNFVFNHSARSGTFDTGLAFFMLAGLLVYWLQWQGVLRRSAWPLVGACAGAACLFKPFVVSCSILGLITLHHLIVSKSSWRQRLPGPVIGWTVCFIVMAPWHIAMWWRLGDVFLSNYIGANILKRAAGGLSAQHVEGPFYYFHSIIESSRTFCWLAWPAIAGACLYVWLGRHSRTDQVGPSRRDGPGSLATSVGACSSSAPGNDSPCVDVRSGRTDLQGLALLLTVTLGFIAVLSTSSSKLPTYVYPVYPLIAIVVAFMLLDAAPKLLGRLFPRLPAPVWIIAACVVAGIFLRSDSKRIWRYLEEPGIPYGPLALYQHLADPLAKRECRLVLCGMPPSFGTVGRTLCSHSTDVYYARYIPDAVRVHTPADVAPLLKDARPILVVMPATLPGAELANFRRLFPPDGEGLLPAKNGVCYPVFSYHQAFARLGIENWVAAMTALHFDLSVPIANRSIRDASKHLALTRPASDSYNTGHDKQ